MEGVTYYSGKAGSSNGRQRRPLTAGAEVTRCAGGKATAFSERTLASALESSQVVPFKRYRALLEPMGSNKISHPNWFV
jgi:hypothetical protein